MLSIPHFRQLLNLVAVIDCQLSPDVLVVLPQPRGVHVHHGLVDLDHGDVVLQGHVGRAHPAAEQIKTESLATSLALFALSPVLELVLVPPREVEGGGAEEDDDRLHDARVEDAEEGAAPSPTAADGAHLKVPERDVQNDLKDVHSICWTKLQSSYALNLNARPPAICQRLPEVRTRTSRNSCLKDGMTVNVV